MNYAFILLAFLLCPYMALAQNTDTRKGSIYTYWGWNWSWYNQSNIAFEGDDYNFELNQVIAKDRQTKFALDPYFHPKKFTIPQYNFRIGYFFHKNWDISIGTDHMKYVVQHNQEVGISGYINTANAIYKGDFQDEPILITEDFLRFEHTDGLNYVNTELRHNNQLLNKTKIKLSILQGIGVGILVPKTNATLLGKQRHDDFNLAGYGFGGLLGANLRFFKYFFIQTELKGGFINMPNIRTTHSKVDKAKQHFFYMQYNILFGCNFKLH